MTKPPEWLAITANHYQLRKVRRRLRKLGHTTYLPAIVSKRTIIKSLKPRRKRDIKPLMRYILIQAPEPGPVRDLWVHQVLSVKDVTGCVGINGSPAWIADSAIHNLRFSVAMMLLDIAAIKRKSHLRKGMKVTIKDGSLAGRAGTVQWVRAKSVGLEAQIFGSKRIITVARENLEAA